MEVAAGEGVERTFRDEPDAAPAARRLTTSTLEGWGLAELVDDATLIVSEAVTNALLHVGPPVTLRIVPRGEGVRISVQDSNRTAPVVGLASAESMTGRGISLVSAVAAAWGVRPLPSGKEVWCDVAADGAPAMPEVDADLEELLASWADDAADEEVYTVTLGEVPTDLLVAAKAHVDNLVREFSLASRGEASGLSAAVPEELARLIDTVVHRFAEARMAIKRQAIAAAESGAPRTHLSLTVSKGSVDAGEQYLAALDEADAWARDARLLTLETPPAHRIFRHWYVTSLVEQVRRAAAGEAPPVPSFERRLLDELGTVAAAQRASVRSARLQAVTGALAAAITAADVANVVVSEGLAVLGARGGTLLLERDGRLEVAAAVGYSEGLVRELSLERTDADLPAAGAIRSGEPVWIESRETRDEAFPALAALEPDTISLCAVPLRVGARVLGALRWSFDTPRLFDNDERSFMIALASQAALALERGELYDAERRARSAAEGVLDRMARLQEVTAALAGARTQDEVARIVVTHAADAIGAAVTTLSRVTADTSLHVVAERGLGSGVADAWRSYHIDDDLPASEAVRTNDFVFVANREELDRRYPRLAPTAKADQSLACVPVSIGERRLGVISLGFPSEHVFDSTELRFLSAFATTCAQALDRATALERAQDVTEKLAFLARASADLSSSLDYRSTLTKVAQLAVPRLADWCSVHVLEDGQYQTLAVAHVDPEKVAFAAEMQQRYPTDPDSPTGVPHVIRSGTSELWSHITEEQVAASAVDADHLEIIRDLGLSSAMIVPLTGRSGTFGALTLIAAESGRHYDASDLAFAEDLAGRAATAVENAEAYSRQTGRLLAITRVAEAAQHAILAPAPETLGPLRLSASYVSAAQDALVGGDLYEVLATDNGVRMVIGDVRGKGLEAVRMATVVLGHFRSAAVECADLASVARQVDARLRPHLGDEDFVTALMVEVRDDGTCEVVSCGHPPAMLVDDAGTRPLGAAGSPPLGLGADPQSVRVQLEPGARVLLYTDGLIEARDASGAFLSMDALLPPLRDGDLHGVLQRLLDGMQDAVGGRLADDLALLLVEYDPALLAPGDIAGS